MKETFEIAAQARTDTGKGASRRLRRTGTIPGIVYGAHKDPEMINLVHNDLMLHLENEAFYSHILTLKVDGKDQQVILKDLQRHPSKPYILHADFLRVSATEKLKTHVPVHLLGEDVAPGVKAGGVISRHLTEIDVICLPGDLPEYIELDMSAMDIGDSVLLSGLTLPAGVEIPALAQEGDLDVPVVSIHAGHSGDDEEEESAEGSVEVPVIGEE